MTTETCTFGGLKGCTIFNHKQKYVLRFEVLEDGQVSIELNHAREEVGPIVVSGTQFKEWWVE